VWPVIRRVRCSVCQVWVGRVDAWCGTEEVLALINRSLSMTYAAPTIEKRNITEKPIVLSIAENCILSAVFGERLACC
jgi:hypothetical protein